MPDIEPRKVMKKLVEIGQSPGDCWEWIGTINHKTGYGKKTFAGKDYLAHRWVFEMLQGPIPEDKVINHICSNRACVNPHHLEVVSQTENCRKRKCTFLTEQQVRVIKRAKENKQWGDGKRLAEEFGVTSATIHDIWNGRSWAEIE